MKGVGGTPGSSHANPIQKEEKIFPGGVMGSMESGRADGPAVTWQPDLSKKDLHRSHDEHASGSHDLPSS